MPGYDIIADIHGYADKLESLLRKLGYRETDGAWRHSGRQALFVGDFIDRGPAQRRTVDTVRRMVDCGAARAVMGNHELNAIAWHMPDPSTPGEFLRAHNSARWGEKNRNQHRRFLEEVESHPELHTEIIEWFLSLPLWLELPEFFVVHACWHTRLIDWLSPQLPDGNRLTGDLMEAATLEPDEREKDGPSPSIFKAVECVLKGIEIPLPPGHTFLDKDGHVRNRVRVRWWDSSATTFRTAAMRPSEDREALPDLPIPDTARVDRLNKPVFFGHYWLTGDPVLQSTSVACVDYSAGRGGPLVAYRFDGETMLTPTNLTWVA